MRSGRKWPEMAIISLSDSRIWHTKKVHYAGKEALEALGANPNRLSGAPHIRLPAIIFFWVAAIKAGGEL
jgi:hypothetical protein